MAQSVQISCINKSDRYNVHERIINIGGVNPDNTRWKMTEKSAIDYIESGKYQFYVSVGHNSVWVVIAEHNGRKYLRTERDDVTSNNLLSLPECPKL